MIISHSWFHNTIFETVAEYLRCLSMNLGLEITGHVYNTRTINHRINCFFILSRIIIQESYLVRLF